MEIRIPNLSLVVLVGPSGCGKSTFARKHFLPTEVLSSDACRGMISDDESDQAVTKEAFEVLHFVARKRLAGGRLTVADATNVQREARQPLLAIAREYHAVPVAFVFDLPRKLCEERNRPRPDRNFGPHVIRGQHAQMRRSLRNLRAEGFRHVYVLASQEQVDAAAIARVPLPCDSRGEHGPFDIIGDVHGCCDEMEELLGKLGYRAVAAGAEVDVKADAIGERAEGALEGDQGAVCSGLRPLGPGVIYQEDSAHAGGAAHAGSTPEAQVLVWGRKAYVHPEGRKAVFLGDLVDRGPRVVEALRIVHNMVRMGSALSVPGNHERRLRGKLQGRDVQITHGLAESLADIDALPEPARGRFRGEAAEFIYRLVHHYVLDDGRLVVAHAGMKEQMQGRSSAAVYDFALYGETTGETDEFGLPVRHNWAAEYRGKAEVLYGHTPVPKPEWLNRTVNLDTGCVFGGRLTALRWPEREFVSVPARRTYCRPLRPLPPPEAQAPAGLTAQQAHDDLLDADDVIGRRHVTTRLRSTVTVREGSAMAALELMSRFAANPKWLIYLPPTMSPCPTSREAGYLEYPTEAFADYRAEGIGKVVCEAKHMGSRAVAIICRDEAAARRRFGVVGEGAGVVYTRTGRRFFDAPALEAQLLQRLRLAADAGGLWQQLATDWLCLDCELMPWSAKAQDLLRSQYAAVGAAGRAALPEAIEALERAAARAEADGAPAGGQDALDLWALLQRFRRRRIEIDEFIAAYRTYCWPVESIDDLKLAPFHLLAGEAKVYAECDHVWHMETLARLCGQDPGLLLATPYKIVDLVDPAGEAAGTDWWLELTARGGEGMVVKPMDFVARGRRGLVQPAIKCRGREYLRIIYGPEYTAEEHLQRLRRRGLAAKRSLAIREFALGVEAMERFVRGEPLRRVHECVFGVLALESEPVDPRL